MRIRPATAGDAPGICDILLEAASWLERRGMPMWREEELRADRIAADVRAGLFIVADAAGELAGTLKFQLADPEFWPDAADGDAAYLHRLAVRRQFAGGVVSALLLSWAAERATTLGRHYLRLDCEASRTKLREIYERAGFHHHSDRQVGPYFVARYERPLRP